MYFRSIGFAPNLICVRRHRDGLGYVMHVFHF